MFNESLISRIALLLLILYAIPVSEASRPNLVLFTCDDLSLADTSVYGSKVMKTPSLQKMADAGLTFDRFYANSSTCAPSRAVAASGLYSIRNGCESNHGKMKQGIKTLPEYLNDLGYTVITFGKCIAGPVPEDKGYAFEGRNRPQEVTRFLQSWSGDKPLCICYGAHNPHGPWAKNKHYRPEQVEIPPGVIDTPLIRQDFMNYYTDIDLMDEELGAVYDTVYEHLGNNTLFLFSSDNGQGWFFGKWNLYEMGIRMPTVAVWPAKIKSGTRTAALAGWVDILPTFVELAGGTPPEHIDGRSFVSVLLGQSQSFRQMIFAQDSAAAAHVYPARCIVTPQYKYILNMFPEFRYSSPDTKQSNKIWADILERAQTDPNAAAFVRRVTERPREELYDLSQDPHEQKDLAGCPQHEKTLQLLRYEMSSWMIANNDRGILFGEPALRTDPPEKTARFRKPQHPGDGTYWEENSDDPASP